MILQEFIVQPSIMNSKVFAGLTIKAENNGPQVLDLVYLTNPIITFAADAIHTILSSHHPIGLLKKPSTKNIDFEVSN